MSEFLANRISVYIHNNVKDASSIAVLKYALQNLFNAIFVNIITLTICALTGHFIDGLIAVTGFPILKYFSGGIHLKSSSSCIAFSSVLMFIAVYIPIDFWYTGLLFFTFASIAILLLRAPAGIHGISKIKEEHYYILRIIAVLIVSVNFFLQWPVLSWVFFLQSLLCLNSAQRFVDYYKI